MRAPAPTLLQLAAADHGGERQAVGDGLGQGHDVGHDAGVLEAPHLARPCEAGLDLVEDEQDAVLIGQASQALEEARRRRTVAALALDGLDEDGCHVLWRDLVGEVGFERREAGVGGRVLVALEVAVDVREGRQVDARQERLVAMAVVGVRAGDAGRPERPAVEAAAEGDDARPTGHPTSHLEGALDGLRARVEEEDRIERVGHLGRDHLGQTVDRLGEADRARRRDEAVDLRVDGGGDGGMMVPERRDGDAVGEVEIRPAFDVEQAMPLAMAPGALEIAAQDRRQVVWRCEGGACRGRGARGRLHRRSV